MLILDNLEHSSQTIKEDKWQFFTDGAMGKLSYGKI